MHGRLKCMTDWRIAQPPNMRIKLQSRPCIALCTQDQLRRVSLDPAADASPGQLPDGLRNDQMHQVLALRGLLAGGVLAHVLQKRHLVDYGVNRWVGKHTWHAGNECVALLCNPVQVHYGIGDQGPGMLLSQ